VLRLRCYLFGKMVREQRDRILDSQERAFLDRHRLSCEECRIRELNTRCSLEALKSVDVAPTARLTTPTILESIEKAKNLKPIN
jgi:hypothetical protein